jgi:N-acetylmuramoyl-L-alanine amidase
MRTLVAICLLALSWPTAGRALENDVAQELEEPAWRVVIDPGHGGRDTGAESENGLAEKTLALEVARRAASILSSSTDRIQVALTRGRDEAVPLRERALSAERYGADLFVSVHANASSDRGAHGAEVFFLALDGATDAEAGALAVQENAALAALEESHEPHVAASEEVASILVDVTREETIIRSSRLAESVVAAYRAGRAVPDRGVKQADFAVLRSVRMPSILVEIGFVTNAGDARRLASATYRQRIAEGIALGVENFLSTEAGRSPVAYYFVRDGDTMTTVAHRHRITAQELASMNNLPIGRLEVGQRLRVPM